MGFGVIDRFEGDMAVIETEGKTVIVKRHLLPPDAREGDVVDMSSMKIDRNKTRNRKNKINRLMRDVWEDSD
ncbi:DUF3006 domain-containing protein [Caldanaerobius polysaccharolyticus]|uniref:DUF3006 domain-containing protein n=1 Tax=Caldanaerobius polysaccharolyticus TaxID=44256 RepID=UPI00047CB332|nr:DUF3006 domain-containing protein [Caldanaerobius polysaccharolyticus]